MQLYVKTGCPFCKKVLDVVEKYNIPIEEKNIADEGVADELIEKGGKRLTPFLYEETPSSDTGRVLSMYESDDIVAYLEERFGGSEPHVKVHVSSTSPVCPAVPDEEKEE